VVDDSEEIRFLLKTMLENAGYGVDVVPDGSRALDALRQEQYHLVVLDVMMPVKDGYTVLREMREVGLRDATRVLMLTAKSTDADWARGYQLGVDEYLTKPFDPEELIDAVDNVLGMTKEQLRVRREDELDRARILSRLQSLLGG
jgi:DNA-binding response OmpR family regulator